MVVTNLPINKKGAAIANPFGFKWDRTPQFLFLGGVKGIRGTWTHLLLPIY